MKQIPNLAQNDIDDIVNEVGKNKVTRPKELNMVQEKNESRNTCSNM